MDAQLDLFAPPPPPPDPFPTALEPCLIAIEAINAQCEQLEDELKRARARQSYLTQHVLNEVLPDDLTWDRRRNTAQVSYTDAQGAAQVVTVKRSVHTSVLKEQRHDAHAWLKANGYGHLLKTHVTAQFPAGRLREASRAFALLCAEHAHDDEVAIEVTHELPGATMAAWVRKQLQYGNVVPDYFSVHTTLQVLHPEAEA